MTEVRTAQYCRSSVEAWQSKAAFVVQFRESTDIGAGRLEGKVEHIASYESVRFHSLDELLTFVARVLAGIRDPGASS
jgi:hypothetical protein